MAYNLGSQKQRFQGPAWWRKDWWVLDFMHGNRKQMKE